MVDEKKELTVSERLDIVEGILSMLAISIDMYIKRNDEYMAMMKDAIIRLQPKYEQRDMN